MSETQARESDELEAPMSKKAVVGWCIYDWANSAFPTIVITFVFSNYFARAVAASPEEATSEWGFAISLSGLAVALFAPILGAVADLGGRRKPWLLFFTLACVVSGAALWTIKPDHQYAAQALIIVAVANFTYELGQVFYNAMLPDVAPRKMIGRISGWSWGLGYAGGLVCLVICLYVLIQPSPPLFGLDAESAQPVRAAMVLVSLWFLVFSLPLFFWTPDRKGHSLPLGQAIGRGIETLIQTFKDLKTHANIARFLIARMIYTDGLNTLFIFGGVYAAGRFQMNTDEVLLFAILLNITAGLGAAAFGWVDDWIGAKKTIVIAVIALTILGAAILLAESKTLFYVLGAILGIFVGPAQSASRSLMGRLAPPEIRTEMYGIYALSGRVTAFLGPALVGWITAVTASQQLGMTVILVFFLVGLVLMYWVKDAER